MAHIFCSVANSTTQSNFCWLEDFSISNILIYGTDIRLKWHSAKQITPKFTITKKKKRNSNINRKQRTFSWSCLITRIASDSLKHLAPSPRTALLLRLLGFSSGYESASTNFLVKKSICISLIVLCQRRQSWNTTARKGQQYKWQEWKNKCVLCSRGLKRLIATCSLPVHSLIRYGNTIRAGEQRYW